VTLRRARRCPGLTTRREGLELLGAALVGGALTRSAGALAGATPVTVELRLSAARKPIDPLVFGNNDIGTMGGGAPSATLDRPLGVTLRRLGGNAVSTYNWTNGANNFGKDWHHLSGLGVPGYYLDGAAAKAEQFSAIRSVHERALADRARSLIQLPIGPWVAADTNGVVTPNEAAPSPRWTPVTWTDSGRLEPSIDRRQANIPQLLRRLVARYGRASSGKGILAYSLDNEPALWHESHPRAHPRRMPIATFLKRSVEAARRIKAIDPSALVLGPSFWGSTALVDFHDAPDWRRYASRYDSMLALYLHTFRKAERRAGRRLLDLLDVHWYPYSDYGQIRNTTDPALASAILDAPRTLTEPNFVERSWVGRSLGRWPTGGLSLPILPSLREVVRRWYPGTGLAVTEFNYGHLPESALALADVLCRYLQQGVRMACHWGRLVPPIGEAYRLYRDVDGSGTSFAGSLVPTNGAPSALSVAAALDRGPAPRLHVVLINRSEVPLAVTLRSNGGRTWAVRAAAGFSTLDPHLRRLDPPVDQAPLVVPALSAHHYLLQ